MPAETPTQVHHLEADLQAALIWKLTEVLPQYLDEALGITGQGDMDNQANPAIEVAVYVGHSRSTSILKKPAPYQESEDLYYDIRILVQALTADFVDPDAIDQFQDLAVDRKSLEVLGAVKSAIRAFAPVASGVMSNIPFSIAQTSLKEYADGIFHWSVMAKITLLRGPDYDQKYTRFEHLLPEARSRDILPEGWRDRLKIEAGIRRSLIGAIGDDDQSSEPETL